MTTHTERSNAARKAASRLMRSGLDCGRDLKSPEAIDWLADVALHIGSLDPIEIGAGAILESSGHARGARAVDAGGVLMLLLATQAEPQMVEHAHPNLGRLIQPRHYNALPATIARGVPWAADNDCFQRLDAHAYYAMLDRLHHIGGRCLFVAVPDVVADAYATARQFERWWTGPARRGLPVALVAQDGLEHMGRWMSMVWPRIDALFIGGSTEWKLGPAARAFVREAKRRGLWVHMGRVNSVKRIAYAAEIGCDSIDGTGWMRWRNIRLPTGLQAASAPPRVALPGLGHDSIIFSGSGLGGGEN